MSNRHEFLSEAWFAAVQEIAPAAPPPPPGLEGAGLNLVVTDGPEGDVKAHLMQGVIQLGVLDDVDTQLTMPYMLARQLFIDNNPQAAMQAFMSGRIKVDGDVGKVMGLQGAAADPAYQAFSKRIQSLTA